MRFINAHNEITQFNVNGILGLGLLALVGCSQGETPTATSAPGGSAALQGPIIFVNNTASKSLTSVALRGDSGNAVIGTIPSAKFEEVTLGDMQFSEGEWLFVNITGLDGNNQPVNKVATIDPLTNAQPVHEQNLVTGTRPVHIYRDPTDGEVIWSMNDGDNITGTTTPGDDLINCAAPTGGSVTILHNSHLGPGAVPPAVIKTECLLADGHKVAAFSSGVGIPKRTFISSTTAGEIAVIGNDPAIPGEYRKLIGRIDLCTDAGEALNGQGACDVNANAANTPNTPNKSNPHGIRFSKLTGKIYSIQENYRTIVEVDPSTLVPTLVADLSATNYTAYGISPDGRFLLLRGDTTPATGTKLGVIDLGTAGNPLTNFTIPELAGTSPGLFKFSPDGNRFYILAGNAAATTKKDRLFAFDASTLTSTPPELTLLKEIPLTAGGDTVGFNAAHNIDVLAQGAPGAGEAKYIVVSNRLDNSVSIINATTHTKTQDVQVGLLPGAVQIYYPGAVAAGNQASN
jgi:YVTN family beta-propeller protein